MIFFYRAKTKEGENIEGMLESSDKFSVAHELRLRGFTPLYISKKDGMSFGLYRKIQNFLGNVSVQEQITFTKNLSGMLNAGLSLSRGISVLKKQTKNDKFNEILTTLSNEIDGGGTFSSGLSKFPNIFSQLFVSIVRAGEESGNLSGSLTQIGENLEKSHNLSKKVRGALIYPGVILSAMILIGILMLAFIIPTLAATFKSFGAQLPGSTRFIISLGEFFSHNLLLSFCTVIFIGVGGFYLFRAKFMAKYVDFFILKIPMIGTMSKELNTARTARTISSLLVSGVPITRAIEITQEVVQNIYYKKVLDDAKLAIEKGYPISQVFISNPNLYPIMMSEMVQVGEETGKLSDMLLQIALFYEEEINNKTKNLSTIIEPVLMLIIGGAVGFFAISIIKPIYSIMDKVK